MPILLTHLAIFGLAIWSFINPSVGSWWYLSLFCVLHLGMKTVQWLGYRKIVIGPNSKLDFTEAERYVLKKYFAHCQYTMSSINTSSTLAAVGFCSILLTPWLLYSGQLIQAGIIGASTFLSFYLSFWFNPVNRLKTIYEKTGNEEIGLQLNSIRSVIAKINNIPISY